MNRSCLISAHVEVLFVLTLCYHHVLRAPTLLCSGHRGNKVEKSKPRAFGNCRIALRPKLSPRAEVCSTRSRIACLLRRTCSCWHWAAHNLGGACFGQLLRDRLGVSFFVPVRPVGSLSVMDMDAQTSRVCFAELPLEIQGRIFENLLEPKGASIAVRRALFVCKAWQSSPFHAREGPLTDSRQPPRL
jgi:hypothetical protein